MPDSFKKVAVCCTTIHKEPMKPIIDCLARRMRLRDYRMVVFQCFELLFYNDRNDAGAKTVFDVLNIAMFDFVVLFPTQCYDKETFKKICAGCQAAGVPYVVVDDNFGEGYHIRFGYGEAFGNIVEHVLSVHKAKRIKFFAGMRDNEFSQTRIDSCRGVMAKHGLELREADIMYGNFWDGPTYEEMEKFFESGEPLPDAFICSNDSMAIAVCTKLSERGFSVPEDVIVTGFDGIEMERYHRPRLCTAIRDNDELADEIIALADRIIAGESFDSYERELIYKPVFSESCGCAKIDLGLSNKKLTDFVRGYSQYRDFEEHIDKMENRIAADASAENVRNNLRKYGFVGSVICVTEKFHDFFSVRNADENNYKNSVYPQDMFVFVNTCSDSNAEETRFCSDILLPDLDSVYGNFNLAYILPVHFQEVNIGYMATPYSSYEYHNEGLCAFSVSLDRSLESMRTHAHLAMLNDRLGFLFTHDQLTGIYNRYGFYENFSKGLEGGKDVFIVSADLNDMKYINDTFGHAAGDEALTICANALTGAADGDEAIICSRFGGDEFVVARICGGDAKERGEKYHERFDKALADLNARSGKPFEVQISFGVYSASLSSVDSVDSLIELADALMYSDKARYKRNPRNLPKGLIHKNNE